MKEKQLNSLSTQSKRKLFSALTQLMREKDYSKITVSELSEKAGLDRRTFYRHFKSKEEIIDLIIVEAFHKHVQNMHGLNNLSTYEVKKAYFELLLEYMDALTLLKNHGLLPIVQKRISEFLPLLYQMFSGKDDCDDEPHCDEHESWAITYNAGGTWAITERWIEEGAKEPPAKMAHLIAAFTDEECFPEECYL